MDSQQLFCQQILFHLINLRKNLDRLNLISWLFEVRIFVTFRSYFSHIANQRLLISNANKYLINSKEYSAFSSNVPRNQCFYYEIYVTFISIISIVDQNRVRTNQLFIYFRIKSFETSSEFNNRNKNYKNFSTFREICSSFVCFYCLIKIF